MRLRRDVYTLERYRWDSMILRKREREREREERREKREERREKRERGGGEFQHFRETV